MKTSWGDMIFLISVGVTPTVNGATFFTQSPDFSGLQPSWNQEQTQDLTTPVVFDNFSLPHDASIASVSWHGGCIAPNAPPLSGFSVSFLANGANEPMGSPLNQTTVMGRAKGSRPSGIGVPVRKATYDQSSLSKR